MTKLGITHDVLADCEDVDTEPAKRSLAAALHAVDNMQALVNLMATNSERRAAAINVGKSADGRVSIYVTASDNVDEVAFARAAIDVLESLWGSAAQQSKRAALVRLVVAQQWGHAISQIKTRWCCSAHIDRGPELQSGPVTQWLLEQPCAVDAVAALFGAPR